MPKGYPGTLTHNSSAYFNGRCKCDVCREAANEHRRLASWVEARKSGLRHVRCPAHGSLVVQTIDKRWLWKCHECLQQAGYGLSRFLNGAR